MVKHLKKALVQTRTDGFILSCTGGLDVMIRYMYLFSFDPLHVCYEGDAQTLVAFACLLEPRVTHARIYKPGTEMQLHVI